MVKYFSFTEEFRVFPQEACYYLPHFQAGAHFSHGQRMELGYQTELKALLMASASPQKMLSVFLAAFHNFNQSLYRLQGGFFHPISY